MKRQMTTGTGTVKSSVSNDPRTLQASPWTKTDWPKADKQSDAPPTPPVWTRYIDSRLKQFCVR